MEGIASGISEILSRNFNAGTEETHEEFKSG
jgi:hypothetical protein